MNTQYCFLNSINIPDRDQWQAAIEKLTYDLQLAPEFSPFGDGGFLPCTLNGEKELGFEIAYGTTDECVEEGDPFEKHIGNRSDYISLSWGSSFKDCACALIATLALIKSFDAVTTYDGEVPDSIADIVSGIEESFREIGRNK
jgi:hypothetical protein